MQNQTKNTATKSVKRVRKIPSPVTKKKLQVALVHDYLREYGGAERVLEALHDMFPYAPVYVSFTDPQVTGIHWQKFANWDIRQSWLTKIPGYKKFFSPLRIFAPSYFSSFNLSEYDLVISSSNAYFAKAVRVRPDAEHISYCHTPARSLYGYTTMTDWKKNPFINFGGMLINHYLRIIDFRVAQKVDHFIANSVEVQQRIRKFYRRESTVIFPPVNVPSTPPVATKKGEYYVYVSRLAFSKHPELAVQACEKLGLPLKVVGEGKMLDQLKKLAGPHTELLGAVPDAELIEIYRHAKALIYPVENEDFGIVPVEAMGYGVPVLAHRSGGPRETVVEGQTGLFFDQLTVEAVCEAIQQAEKINFNPKKIHAHARKFSKETFKRKVEDFIRLATTRQK